MSDILNSYTALSLSSPRSDVSSVLDSIINALPFTFTPSSREELLKILLQDLKSSGSRSRLTSKDAAQALLALKTLGRDPSGSDFLASPLNMSTLLELSSSLKDDPDASSEALRCLANALLLIERARGVFIEKDVNGGEICLTMLEKSNSPDQIFILSRILFLCTVSGPSYIESIVEEKHNGRTISEIVGSKLDTLTVAILSGTKMSKEAMSDLLKFTFNLLLHYPKMAGSELQTSEVIDDDQKVMGDYWSPKLEGFLIPLLRVFNCLPPTFPSPIAAPMTHVIHSLITIPVSSSLRPLWFGAQTPPDRITSSNSPKSTSSHSPRQGSSSPISRSASPTRSTPPPKPSTIDRALSVLTGACRPQFRSLSSNSSPTDILQRAFDLFEVSFSHFFPGDIEPDDSGIRATIKKEIPDNSLDDVLSPLVVLITRLCIADDASRARVRQWLVPDDLDRSSSLETRPDLLGRCLRILSSVYHPRLKDSVGELLFAMADSNASTLSALVGYGNVAGFLFHKGVLSAPPSGTDSSNVPLTTPSGATIDPITGTTISRKADLPEMSEEEKEREMEKLFVLFDRLEKTGSLPPSQNPIRKAMQGGSK